MKWTVHDETYVLSSNDSIKEKVTKTGRKESAIRMRLSNALYVLTRREGLSHFSKQTKRVTLELKERDELCNYLKSKI